MSLTDYPLKVICDTSVYIPFINQGVTHTVFSDDSVKHVLYMIAVVISELHAGAHESQTIKLLDKLYRTFQSIDRLIIPDDGDWRQAGSIIAKLGKKINDDGRGGSQHAQRKINNQDI